MEMQYLFCILQLFYKSAAAAAAAAAAKSLQRLCATP